MKHFRHVKILFLLALPVIFYFSSCKQEVTYTNLPLTHAYNAKVYLKWNDKFLELDRYAKGNRPGSGPRVLAYMGLSAYESVVGGMPENNSLAFLFPGLSLPAIENDKEYYWPACINESYAFLMKRFLPQVEDDYPDLFAGIDLLYNQLHQEYAAETTPEILERSEAYGRAVAQAVYEWEKTDLAGHNAYLNIQPTNYQPPVGPGLWQPTWPDYGAAVFPYWGQVRTFALKGDELISRAPLPYSESETSPFFLQAMETYSTVNNINANGAGAYDGKWRGEFWSDDMVGVTFGPPSRLLAIANQVVALEDIDLATCAELYAKIGMAMSDAGVSVWKSKYIYNVERPISYIRRVVSQKFPEAANWKSNLNHPYNGTTGFTPPFPAYPSGHSGFGGAGTRILSAFFEYNDQHPGGYTFTDYCHKNRTEFIGTPRTFSSFKELGDEDAYSRIPLGVHFRMDCEEGVRLGELAAQRVLELPWKK